MWKRKTRAEKAADAALLAVERDLGTPLVLPFIERRPRYRVTCVDRTADMSTGDARIMITLDRVG
jgi:hypothetical protein